MNAIRFGRLRAGLTQRELARRAGISQPALARIECGHVVPRLDTAARLLRECGMRLEAIPRAGEGVDRTTIRRMLALSPHQRLALAAREARNLDAAPCNPLRILKTLNRHDVRFVVIEGIAGRLRGSTTVTNDVDICHARDGANFGALALALRELKADADARALKFDDHFTFTTIAGNLDILGTPKGSGGYEALARTATKMDVGGVTVLVASLEDLIQMKRAAGRPKDLVEVEILSAVRDEIEES